ncbi:hypothetical protein IWX90DRAFT_421503 [Phyllosticta citrichinensis]|uniref:Uncharacterized protein n=1 Tax=Phyllosticta citrichinensis TaxID=1130410 RepID=A0ABR1Y7T0_9PEZI
MIRPGTPIVAIKYSLPDGMARRFQLRFSSEDDFRIAYDVIHRAGIQISESPALPKPASRASSSHSVPNFSSSLPPSSPPKVDVWHARQEIRRPTSSALSVSQLPTIVERPPLRPSTAPTADLGRPGQMPPRRELPFSRPPSSSAQSLPGSRTASKRKTTPNQTPIDDTDKHRRTSALASSANLPPLVPPRLGHPSHGDTTSSATTALGVGGPDLESPRQVEQSLQGMSDPYSLQQHRPRSSSTAIAWQGRPTNVNAASSDQIESEHTVLFDSGSVLPQSTDGQPAASPGSMASAWGANLTAYSRQSVQDRENQLDDIFAHCIHDDNFLLLCQDVASRWHRLYLGSI